MNNDPGIVTRRRRVFELRMQGLTIPAISKKLRDEGWKYGTSERTIADDLHTAQVEGYKEELLRMQLEDINNSLDPIARMRFRNLLLDKFMPTQMQVESSVTVDSTSAMPWMLDPEMKKALLEEHERQKAERAKVLGTNSLPS